MTHQKTERQTHHEPDAPHTKTLELIHSPAPEYAKERATLAAKLALRGFALRECETGGFFVSRWNLTKFCRDLSDVEDFAQAVRVKP